MEPTTPYPAGVCTVYPPASKNVWRVRWKGPDGRKERTATSQVAAEEIAARVTAEQSQSTTAVNITVKFLADAYLASLHEGTYKERQEGLCRLWIVPEIAETYIKEWRPAQSRIILQRMADAGVGKERTRNCAQALRALVTYAQTQGWFTAADDPMLKVKQPHWDFDEDREDEADVEGEAPDFVARDTLPTLDDIELIIKSAPDRWGLAWRLAAFSGVRWGELIALKGSDVNLQKRTIKVAKSVSQHCDTSRHLKSTKNKKRRLSIYPASLAEGMEERVEAAGSGLLFPGPDGTWAERTWHRRRWIRAAQQAGWPFEVVENPTANQLQWPTPSWTFHDLRHFAACWMIFDLKAPLPTVTAWLGHHSPSFTFNKYVGQRGDGAQIGLDLTESW